MLCVMDSCKCVAHIEKFVEYFTVLLFERNLLSENNTLAYSLYMGIHLPQNSHNATFPLTSFPSPFLPASAPLPLSSPSPSPFPFPSPVPLEVRPLQSS